MGLEIFNPLSQVMESPEPHYGKDQDHGRGGMKGIT